MRILTVLILLLLAVIGFGVGVNSALASNAQNLTAGFSSIEQDIKKNNWIDAKEKILKVEQNWSKSKNWWAVVIDHQEIDNIEFTFSRIKSFIDAKNTGLTLGELAVLKESIKHIPEKEKVKLKNIL